MRLHRNAPPPAASTDAAAPAPQKLTWRRPAPVDTQTHAGVSPPPPEELPGLPTFADLSERESLFVVEYASRSGTRGAGADAALAAGYGNGNRNTAHARASELLRRPQVLRALKEEVGRKLAASAPLGVAVLEQLAQSAKSEQVRLAAANSLVDRGYGVPLSRNANLNLNATATVEQLLDKLDRHEERSSGPARPKIIDARPSRVSGAEGD